MLLGANFINGGLKEAKLELLALKLYENIKNNKNIIFIDQLKSFKDSYYRKAC